MKKPLRRFLLLFVFCGSATGVYAQAFSLSTHVFTSGLINTTSTAFAGVSATHDLIVVDITWSGITQTVTSVTDSKLNVYTKINGTTRWDANPGPANNFSHELWYAPNITGGGAAITITVKLSANTVLADGLKYIQIYGTEYSGILFPANPLDQNCVVAGSGPTPNFTACSVTTLFKHELIYATALGETMQNISNGALFTQRNLADGNCVEDENVVVNGTYSPPFKNTAGGTYIATVATFIALVALPVKLLNFNAEQNASVVDLDWTTATETNNAYFTVEKSQNSTDFISIAKMDGAGNSSFNKYYSVVDDAPYTGLSYYRLKQTDYDGNYTYSDIVPVNYVPADNIVINYVTSGNIPVANISSKENNVATLEVIDMTGRVVSSKVLNLNTGVNNIPLTQSSNGIYLLRLLGSDGSIVMKKFAHAN
jgi:hypothetical protein